MSSVIFLYIQPCMHRYTHTHQVKEVYVKEKDSIDEDEVVLEFYHK